MNERLQSLVDTVQRTASQVGGAAADAAYGVGRRAGELLSSARLQMQIAGLEGRVEGCFAEIGEMNGISRQGVNDALRKAKEQLIGLEDALHLAKKTAALAAFGERLKGENQVLYEEFLRTIKD